MQILAYFCRNSKIGPMFKFNIFTFQLFYLTLLNLRHITLNGTAWITVVKTINNDPIIAAVDNLVPNKVTAKIVAING